LVSVLPEANWALLSRAWLVAVSVNLRVCRVACAWVTLVPAAIRATVAVAAVTAKDVRMRVLSVVGEVLHATTDVDLRP
jgi:hypothetical protein